MNKKIEFPEHIIIVDVEFLNFMVSNFREFLSTQLNRELPDLSIAELFTCLALDSKIEEGVKEIQVLLLHDKNTSKLQFATPSSLEKELNGVAFKSSLGEFVFSAVSTENLTSVDTLFLDLLTLGLESEKTKKILLISDDQYDEDLIKLLKEKSSDNKEVFQFRMVEPEIKLPCKWDMLVFPLMKAFGVEGDEI